MWYPVCISGFAVGFSPVRPSAHVEWWHRFQAHVRGACFLFEYAFAQHPFGMDTLPCTHLTNNYHTQEFSMNTDIQIGLKNVRLQCVHMLTCVSSMGCGCDRFLQVCKVIRPGSVPTCFCVDGDPSTFPDSRSRQEVKTKHKQQTHTVSNRCVPF